MEENEFQKSDNSIFLKINLGGFRNRIVGMVLYFSGVGGGLGGHGEKGGQHGVFYLI